MAKFDKKKKVWNLQKPPDAQSDAETVRALGEQLKQVILGRDECQESMASYKRRIVELEAQVRELEAIRDYFIREHNVRANQQMLTGIFMKSHGFRIDEID